MTKVKIPSIVFLCTFFFDFQHHSEVKKKVKIFADEFLIGLGLCCDWNWWGRKMESQFCLLFKCYAISEFSGHIVMSLFSFQCDTHGTFGGPTRLCE